MEQTKGDGFTLNVSMPSNRVSGMARLLAEVKRKTIRSRILSALFGEQNEFVIILPSRNVRNVTFTRAEDQPAPENERDLASEKEDRPHES